MTPLRIVFFGTPEFAVHSLRALAGSRHEVIAVVTQPDRPKGRGHRVAPPPVKAAAEALGIPTSQPTSLGDADVRLALAALAPDLGVVAAYGRILPVSILETPRLGMINVHASLLPRWRGAAPIHRAILAGDPATGVTIMRVVKALDAGPMLAREETAIGPSETSTELETRLATLGAALLVRVVDRLAAGPVPGETQDESRVTYASRLERRDGHLDFDRPARDLHNAIRGLQPWPLADAMLGGRRVRFLQSAQGDPTPGSAAPGTVLAVERDALVVATGSGSLRLLRVQLNGKPAMAVRDFVNGHAIRAGDRFTRTPDDAS